FMSALTPSIHAYPLSLHDALPISRALARRRVSSRNRRAHRERGPRVGPQLHDGPARVCQTGSMSGIIAGHEVVSCNPATGAELGDRKSTRLNSSHGSISYSVFCLK